MDGVLLFWITVTHNIKRMDPTRSSLGNWVGVGLKLEASKKGKLQRAKTFGSQLYGLTV